MGLKTGAEKPLNLNLAHCNLSPKWASRSALPGMAHRPSGRPLRVEKAMAPKIKNHVPLRELFTQTLDGRHPAASFKMAIDGLSILCHSERATDYYGLGVRLGVYFTWLGSYVANTILPSEFGPASDTSTIFLLTLLIAMANDSRIGDLHQIDGLVLMQLCGGSLFGIISLWGLWHAHTAGGEPRGERLRPLVLALWRQGRTAAYG